jgi:site-specific recombinase XerD
MAQKKARAIEEKYERAELGQLGKAEQPVGITVAHAVLSYLEDKEEQHLSSATLDKLKTIFQKQFLPWCSENDVRFIVDVTLPHLQKWRTKWKDGALAARKKQERLRGFFYFCQRNKWVADNPAAGLSSIKADIRPADWFNPDDWTKIVQATHVIGKREEDRVRVRALVFLLRFSGLAIRDAVTLERGRLDDKDRLILRRAKTGQNVFVPLQPQVASLLRTLPNGNPRYFFWSGNGLPKSAVADAQRSLRRVFELADLRHPDGTKRRCHAHMFRHSFAVSLLLSGVSIETIATLLGHSSIRTTEKYYSPFVKARAERIEQEIMSAWQS